MVKLSEKLSAMITNKVISDVPVRGTNISSRIDMYVNAVSWLYVQINIRVYDSPRTEFLKMCNL